MKNKLLGLIVLCLVGILSYAWVISFNSYQSNYEELNNYIDSLNNKINLLKLEKDSLSEIIDSSKVKVNIIEHWYEKELINITNQSIADDVVFFTEYLSKIGK